jgi:hypothetical protein
MVWTEGVRVPASVLLAVLAAAGLLALAPALVRRYDATERLVAERALSTARVVIKAGTGTRRRRRTVPGRRPVNPPSWVSLSPASASAATRRPVMRRPPPPAVYRRRRVLTALVLLNLTEACGVALVGPGFWIGLAFSSMLLVSYLVHLRLRAVAERRARLRAARTAAARQRAHEVRLAARREALRRAAAARAAAQRDATRLSQRYVDWTTVRAVRGRAYQAGSRRDRASGF